MAKTKKSTKKPIEQYEHKGKKRLNNNPPVGLVTPDTDMDSGKKEHTSFAVPTVSLHVHERMDPRTIIYAVKKKNGGPQLSLFESRAENPPLRETVDFYKHKPYRRTRHPEHTISMH